jgi:cell division protein FtsL
VRQEKTHEKSYAVGQRQAALQTPVRETVLSEQARKNQLKALNTNRGFVFFLTLAMIAVMGCCVNYIRLKSEYTAKMGTVANLEAELAQIKEDNDAYYSQVTSNVDLARIKKIAIGRLGMKYPSENQMASYTTSEGSGYVRQYQDLPE